MRIATFDQGQGPELGIVEGSRIAPLGRALGQEMGDAGAFFAHVGADALSGVARRVRQAMAGMEWRTVEEVGLLAPVLKPGKILGIGRNYGAHAAEGGLEAQEKPRFFVKTANAVAGPTSRVRRPEGIRKLDFEAELVVVVGRRLSAASAERAASAIGGYTVGNDLSARELQFDVTPPQTSLAKSMDGFAPTGPWIVTADELGPAPSLAIRSYVNGRLMQEGMTGDLIFSIPTCLAYISQYMTLEPGDLLFTGTPSGVGVFRDPPVFLDRGDVVMVEIDGIGRIETKII